MNLLNKPYDYNEKRNIRDMIDGNICRIFISDDVEEIVRNLGFAIDKLNMIAYSRIKEIKNNEAKNADS